MKASLAMACALAATCCTKPKDSAAQVRRQQPHGFTMKVKDQTLDCRYEFDESFARDWASAQAGPYNRIVCTRQKAEWLLTCTLLRLPESSVAAFEMTLQHITRPQIFKLSKGTVPLSEGYASFQTESLKLIESQECGAERFFENAPSQ